MWLGLQTVSSLERCPLFRVSFIDRYVPLHCMQLTDPELLSVLTSANMGSPPNHLLIVSISYIYLWWCELANSMVNSEVSFQDFNGVSKFNLGLYNLYYEETCVLDVLCERGGGL